MIDLVVIGAGGFGRETLDVIEAINTVHETYRVVGVVDDSPSPIFLERLSARGYTHLGNTGHWLATGAGDCFVVGVGTPSIRSAIVAQIGANAFACSPLIHPRASIGSMFQAGDGTVICANATISTNVSLGAHVHVNPAAIIGHDARCGDFSSVNPGAVISGEVTVAANVLVGAGAVVLQGLAVGSCAVVGAAACAVTSVPAHSVVKGVPAR